MLQMLYLSNFGMPRSFPVARSGFVIIQRHEGKMIRTNDERELLHHRRPSVAVAKTKRRGRGTSIGKKSE